MKPSKRPPQPGKSRNECVHPSLVQNAPWSQIAIWQPSRRGPYSVKKKVFVLTGTWREHLTHGLDRLSLSLKGNSLFCTFPLPQPRMTAKLVPVQPPFWAALLIIACVIGSFYTTVRP
jgi:hypothetical protein